MYLSAKQISLLAFAFGALVHASPYGGADRGLRIPLQPRPSSERLVGKQDDVELGRRTVRAPGFTWGADPMRGVNIGGW